MGLIKPRLKMVGLCVCVKTVELHHKSAAWTRKGGQNPEGGLNAKGRASAKREGHNLKPPVSREEASKSKKSAARRKSFCARMEGMK